MDNVWLKHFRNGDLILSTSTRQLRAVLLDDLNTHLESVERSLEPPLEATQAGRLPETKIEPSDTLYLEYFTLNRTQGGFKISKLLLNFTIFTERFLYLYCGGNRVSLHFCSNYKNNLP